MKGKFVRRIFERAILENRNFPFKKILFHFSFHNEIMKFFFALRTFPQINKKMSLTFGQQYKKKKRSYIVKEGRLSLINSVQKARQTK